MKRLFAALTLVLALGASSAEARTYLVIRGIFGNVVSPMTEIVEGLRARKHKVVVAEWYAVPNIRVDAAIGHSAGADAALRVKTMRIVTIDPTLLNPGCPRGAACTNYFAALNRFPLLICCGGYPVRGARNIAAAPGHTGMPRRLAPQILKGL